MFRRSGCLLLLLLFTGDCSAADALHDFQEDAISQKWCQAAHWGPDPKLYSSWTDHSNRLIPVYTFGTKGGGEGVDLDSYTGEKSCYRDRDRLERLYRTDVDDSVSADAEYMDQTNIFDLQRAAIDAGRKHVFLVVFDGMDWQTTWAAAIYNLHRVAYRAGRGTGTHFQDYQADGASQFGWMVTSPYRSGTQLDVNTQQVKNPAGGLAGGYDCRLAGQCPWTVLPTSTEYLLARNEDVLVRRAYTDSAASATSMCCGIKTYNAAIGVTCEGRPQPSVAHLAQAEGYKVGAVTSVPISHAT
ncbi:MAG: alkaline phosphatase, partial [Planctomycetales bacterium]|nr:alkaline phosphatase [Planctomycetales bacterium]